MRCCVTFRILPSRYGAVVSARDHAELAKFYSVEPWDEMRGDVRTGHLTAVVASAFAGKGAAPKPIDFMPFVKRQRATDADDVNRARALFERLHPERFE